MIGEHDRRHVCEDAGFLINVDSSPRLRLCHVTARAVWVSAIQRVFDPKNAAKGDGWAKRPAAELYVQFFKKFVEFRREIERGDVEGAIREAGDMLAYIAMLIEACEERRNA